MTRSLRSRASQWTRAHPRWADGVLAALVLALDLLLSADVLSWQIVLYAAAGNAALIWRRRWPMIVLGVMLVHFAGAVVLFDDYRPELGVLLALYTVAAHLTPARGLAAWATTFAATAPIIAVDEIAKPGAPGESPASVLFVVVVAQLLLTAAAWAIGRWAQAGRRTLRITEELAELRRRESLRAERAGIARDLHDVVSRAVTVMILQSTRAKLLLDTDANGAAEALEHVRTAGAEAMSELREMLEVLRADDDAPLLGTSIAGAVPAIVARVRGLGIAVDERRTGRPCALEPGTELAAVRVVQEALTNVARHAGPGTAAIVELAWEPGTLRVLVTDDGAGRPDAAAVDLSSGLGLTGLRERVALMNGRIEWGRRAAGGFRVEAELPAAAGAARVAEPDAARGEPLSLRQAR
ncbi:sensor histidine kinase [Pseudonocardia sp.]|uniref:sensor histidine kinase n=1 Tax=Pseudonocardia sp. TaxID=60912 RepID=UPI003D0F7DF2